MVQKRQKDISSIDDKIIAMYAKGMTTRQISETINIFFQKNLSAIADGEGIAFVYGKGKKKFEI